MLKRKLLISIGAAILNTFFPAVIGATDFKNSLEHIPEQRITSEENRIYTIDNFFKQLPNPKNSEKVISINSGFKSLYTDQEKVLYDKIKQGCNKISNQKSGLNFYSIDPIVIKGGPLKVEQIKKVLYAVQNDFPEIFWISNAFSYGYCTDKTNIVKLNSIFSREEKEKFEKKLNEKVSQIISKVPAKAGDYEKELFFHDYIVDNCKYKNTNGNFKIFTAYGCLVEGVAVCEGYSKAMQLLLNRVGVDCRTIVGSRGAEPHMWNLVKINGNWYHLDVTWDAGGEWQRYNYFNVTDDVIKYDHTVNEKLKPNIYWPQNKRFNFNLPVCNCTKENYFEKNAVKASELGNDNNFIAYVVNGAKSRKRYFYLKVDGGLDFERVKREFLFSGIFRELEIANRILASESQINTINISYGVCQAQKVMIVRLSYL